MVLADPDDNLFCVIDTSLRPDQREGGERALIGQDLVQTRAEMLRR